MSGLEEKQGNRGSRPLFTSANQHHGGNIIEPALGPLTETASLGATLVPGLGSPFQQHSELRGSLAAPGLQQTGPSHFEARA